MNISFTVPDAIGAELLLAFQSKYPKINGETDLAYARRITRTYFWTPMLAEHRANLARQAAPVPSPVVANDFGTN